jgi:hypothetical protein
MNPSELEQAFTYQAPSAQQAAAYVDLRANAKAMAEGMVEMCPDSRELSLALTKLRESVMWANAAIALHGLKG